MLALRTREGCGTGTGIDVCVCVCVSGIESKFQEKSEERDIFKATEMISGVFKGVSPIHNVKFLSFCVYDNKSP